MSIHKNVSLPKDNSILSTINRPFPEKLAVTFDRASYHQILCTLSESNFHSIPSQQVQTYAGHVPRINSITNRLIFRQE